MIFSYGIFLIRASKIITPAKSKSFNLYCTCSNININTLPNYNNVDKCYILNKLNENAGELSRFAITKTRIKRLEQWRDKKGKFENLDEVLEVDGFGIKVLEKFYKSILDDRDNITPAKKLIKDKKKNLGFLIPLLTEDLRQNISSVVSVYLSLNAVSWCLFDRNNTDITVKSCSLHDFTLENKRMNFTQVLQLALNLVQIIPSADIYVFESLPSNMPNSSNSNKTYITSTERIQLLSMLSALLANRKNIKENNENVNTLYKYGVLSYENFEERLDNRVYFIRNMLSARLFKIIVGNERISTEPIITQIFENSNKLLENSRNKEPLVLKPVMDLYHSLNPVHKEIFGQALLLGLTCIKACILHDKASIEKLTNRL